MSEVTSETGTLRNYLRAAGRRKWVILQAVVLVPAAGVTFALRQQPVYEASADVLLIRQNLAAALAGTQDLDAGQPADRFAQTQASLARMPLVARKVLRATGIRDRSPQALLRASSVSAKANTDLLEFKVADLDASTATRLATEYARQFARFRRALGTSSLVRARTEVEGQLAGLESRDDRTSALYESLLEKEQQLRTMEAFQTSSSVVVRVAGGAAQVQPKPVRDGLLGLLLGLVLGVGLALLWEALDTRVRSEDEIGVALDLPLLGRLSAPPQMLRSQNRLAMLADAGSGHAEAYRVLRTNLELVNLDLRAETIMVTSAVQGEGKSTTAANLAIAFARAGRRVLLIDLDLRRPFLDRFFGLEDKPGLTAAALGHVGFEEAVFGVALSGSGKPAVATNGNGAGSLEGILEVVPSGPVPPDPGAFLSSTAFATLFESLRGHADLVLIDSPPLLHVGDALALSALVDAVLVVTRLDVVRAPMLVELRRVLDSTRADKLGFVLTGAKLEAGYADGYDYVRAHAYSREVAPERVC